MTPMEKLKNLSLSLSLSLIYENIYEYNITYCISTDKFELSPAWAGRSHDPPAGGE